MSRGKMIVALSVAGLAIVLAVGQAMSQETQQGGRGGREGGQNVDQAQGNQRMQEMRQQRELRMKESLGVTDEEWKVLQPKIEKVRTLNTELMRGQFQGMGGRGGRGGRGPGGMGGPAAGEQAQAAPPSELQKQHESLQKVLENKEAKPAEIKTALAGYREARGKVRANLEKAQKDLRSALTTRQEAQLVMMGTLE